jgi:hypothetical protein
MPPLSAGAGGDDAGMPRQHESSLLHAAAPLLLPPELRTPVFTAALHDDVAGTLEVLRRCGWVCAARVTPQAAAELAEWPSCDAAAVCAGLRAFVHDVTRRFRCPPRSWNSAVVAACARARDAACAPRVSVVAAPSRGGAERYSPPSRSRSRSRSPRSRSRRRRSRSRSRRCGDRRRRSSRSRAERRRVVSRDEEATTTPARAGDAPQLPTPAARSPPPAAAAAACASPAADAPPAAPPAAAPPAAAPPAVTTTTTTTVMTSAPASSSSAAARFHYRNPQSGAVEGPFKLSVFADWVAKGALSAAQAASLRVASRQQRQWWRR